VNEELTSELIVDLKKRHGEIFQMDFGDQALVFRALTLKEFENLAIEEGHSDSAQSEDNIVQTALLYPSMSVLEKMSAGLISVLAEEIIEESSFLNISKAQEILDSQRKEMNDIKALVPIFIISAMPSYKLEDLENKTFNELLYMVAMAEEILGMRFQTEYHLLSGEGGGSPMMLLGDTDEEQNDSPEAQSSDPIAEQLHGSF
jgi:hypothetical protein